MAIAVGQHKVANAVANPTTAAATTTASGSSFLAISIYDGAFTAYNDSKSNSYTNILSAASPTYFGGVIKIRADLCTNGAGGASHTLGFTSSGSNAASLYFLEITGGVTSSLLDVATTPIEDGSSPYTTNASGTLAQADELAIAMWLSNCSGGTAAFTPGNSFTTVDSVTDANNFWTSLVAQLVVSSTSSIQGSMTQTGTGATSGYGTLLTFKAAGGGGGGVLRRLALSGGLDHLSGGMSG